MYREEQFPLPGCHNRLRIGDLIVRAGRQECKDGPRQFLGGLNCLGRGVDGPRTGSLPLPWAQREMIDGYQKEAPVTDGCSQRGDIVLRLPPWLRVLAEQESRGPDSTESRMRFAIEIARQNVEHRTGGPFGAAVFEAASGRVVGVGVNLVEASNCSMAHAEMIAIALAQQAVERYDLSAGGGVYELATSVEPCAMCLGAIPWSGLRRVLCGAHGADAAAIGFDEGTKPADWVGELTQTRNRGGPRRAAGRGPGGPATVCPGRRTHLQCGTELVRHLPTPKRTSVHSPCACNRPPKPRWA